LANAWSGFNASLFAYGQTGSGKSWSVIGYGANKGIVPMFCEELFKQIGEKEVIIAL
jgi:kinesin family protein 1